MKNAISRRSFLKAVGIMSAAGALAACGGKSASTSTAASAAASTAASGSASGASIKLWTYPIGGWGKDETVQELIASFNAKYPDIKVAVEYLDYTNGDDQVNTAIEGGSAPDLIMEGPERLVANWGAKGVMAPLNDLWTDDAKKDIYESVNSACHNDKGDYYEIDDGVLLGLPGVLELLGIAEGGVGIQVADDAVEDDLGFGAERAAAEEAAEIAALGFLALGDDGAGFGREDFVAALQVGEGLVGLIAALTA